MFRFLVPIVLAYWFVTPVTAAAQNASAGRHIRIAYRCDMPRYTMPQCGEGPRARVDTGRLESMQSDTIRILTGSNGAYIAIPRVAVTQAWAVAGRRRHFWAGAGIGFLAGAFTGVLLGSGQDDPYIDPGLVGAVLGAPVGFLLGGLIGAMVTSNRWEPVSIGSLRLSLSTRPSGFAFTPGSQNARWRAPSGR